MKVKHLLMAIVLAFISINVITAQKVAYQQLGGMGATELDFSTPQEKGALASVPPRKMIMSITVTGGWTNAQIVNLYEALRTNGTEPNTILGTVDFSKATFTEQIDGFANFFNGFTGLKKVTMPEETDQTFDLNGTFKGCTDKGFVAINLSCFKNVVSYKETFSGCTNLKEIILGTVTPTDTENGYTDTFKDCPADCKVTLPGAVPAGWTGAGVEFIVPEAPQYTTYVEYVEGEETKQLNFETEVQSGALANATSIVAKGGEWTSARVSALRKALFSDAQSEKNEVLTSADLSEIVFTENIEGFEGLFAHCTKLATIKLPISDKTINLKSAFTGCTSLAQLDLSGFSSVSSYNSAFKDCSGLKTVYLNAVTPTDTENGYTDAFSGCMETCRVYLPENVKEVPEEWKSAPVIFVVMPIISYVEGGETKSLAFNNAVSAGALANATSITLTGDWSKDQITTLRTALKAGETYGDEGNTVLVSADLSQMTVMDNMATGFYGLFYRCFKLADVKMFASDVNVSLQYIFFECKELKKADLTGVTNVSTYGDTFNGCVKLEEVRLGTAIATDLQGGYSHTFDGCPTTCKVYMPKGVTEVPEEWKEAAVTFIIPREPLLVEYIEYDQEKKMDFSNEVTAGALAYATTIKVKGEWTDGQIANLRKALKTDGNNYTENRFLMTADFSKAVFSEDIKNGFKYFFNQCNTLVEVAMPEKEVTVLVNLENAFSTCKNLTTIDLSSLTNIESLSVAFYESEALESVTLPAMNNASTVVDLTSAFSGCKALKKIDLSGFTNVKYFSSALEKCIALESVTMPVKSVPTTETDFANMFSGCTHLKSAVDLSAFTNVKSLSFTFYNCYWLESVKLPTEYTGTSAVNLNGTFKNCMLIKTMDLSAFTNIRSLRSTFAFCGQLLSVKMPTVNANSAAIDFSSAFNNCLKLESIDLTIFTNVNSFNTTFGKCANLREVYLGTVPTDQNTGYTDSFIECTKACKVYLPEGLVEVPEGWADAPVTFVLFGTGIDAAKTDSVIPAISYIYSIDGKLLRSVSAAEYNTLLDGLDKGIYIVNGKKEIVK